MSDKSVLPMKPSVHASRMGLILGGYMCITYLFFMFSPAYPFLSFLCFPLLVLTPIIAYRLGRNYRVSLSDQVGYPFAVAWAHGIQMFICSAIILMLPCYWYYTRVLPEQLPYIELMMEQLYKQAPEARQMWREFYQADPVEMIAQLTGRDRLWINMWSMFSTVTFYGTIISLINAFLLKRK